MVIANKTVFCEQNCKVVVVVVIVEARMDLQKKQYRLYYVSLKCTLTVSTSTSWKGFSSFSSCVFHSPQRTTSSAALGMFPLSYERYLT